MGQGEGTSPEGGKNYNFWPFGTKNGEFGDQRQDFFFIFLEKNKKIMKKQDFYDKVGQI